MKDLRHYESMTSKIREEFNKLLIVVFYKKIGFNAFSGNSVSGGIYISLTPVKAVFVNGKWRTALAVIMSGNHDESGYNVFLKPLSRGSQKQVELMHEKLESHFKGYAEKFSAQEHKELVAMLKIHAEVDQIANAKARDEAAEQKQPAGPDLINKEVQALLDKQGDTSMLDPKDIQVVAKFFNPYGAGVWYLYDRQKDDPNVLWIFATLGDPMMAECGTISLRELRAIRPPVERDRHFNPRQHDLASIMNTIKEGGYV